MAGLDLLFSGLPESNDVGLAGAALPFARQHLRFRFTLPDLVIRFQADALPTLCCSEVPVTENLPAMPQVFQFFFPLQRMLAGVGLLGSAFLWRLAVVAFEELFRPAFMTVHDPF